MALRHIHTIDMHNHKVTVIVPARLFDSEAFLPGTAQPFYREEAKSLLAFLSGQLVTHSVGHHILTYISNQRKSVLPPTAACAA